MRQATATTTSPAVAPGTKQCPMCAETIKEAARVCHFCNARFDVSWQGYCESCHQVVSLGDDDTCVQCHGAVIDRRCSSRLVTQPAAAQAPVQAAAQAPAQPVVQGDLRIGFIGSVRQRIAEIVLGLAVATSMFTTLLGLGGEEDFMFGVLGSSQARPGIWFFFVPPIAAFVGIRRLGPRGFGRAWFRAGYRMRLKAQYGIRDLYKKSGAYVRVAISMALWTLSLVLAFWFINGPADGYDLKAGAFLIMGSAFVGIITTPLLLPGRDNDEVRVDDAGQLFR